MLWEDPAVVASRAQRITRWPAAPKVVLHVVLAAMLPLVQDLTRGLHTTRLPCHWSKVRLEKTQEGME